MTRLPRIVGPNLVFVVVRDGYPRFEPFSAVSCLLGCRPSMLLACCSLLLGGVLVAWVGCRCCWVLLVSAPLVSSSSLISCSSSNIE